MDPVVPRLVHRWLHVWTIVTVVFAAALLLLGEMVTTLRAGMVDPDWPTRPWHLALDPQEKWTAGYLVEHTHRILGFLVGGLVSVLAVAAWAHEPRKGLRWAAIVSIVALLVGFGYFHQEMRGQIGSPQVGLPVRSTMATLVPLAALAVACVAALIQPTPATGVRVLTAAALVAVMIQGLLGGLRVRLNELVGTDLAAVHGVFATLVLSLLIAIPVLSARGPMEPLPIEARKKLAWQTATLVVFTLAQIVFGAMVRHMPDRMSARLHLFFAFVVVGFATLAIKQALADPVTKRRLNWPARFLMALITLQILFGVEAWMGKFMTDVAVDAARAPSIGQAILRTAHAHIGAWILAVGVVFALVSRRKPVERVGPVPPASVNWQEPIPRLATTGVRSPA